MDPLNLLEHIVHICEHPLGIPIQWQDEMQMHLSISLYTCYLEIFESKLYVLLVNFIKIHPANALLPSFQSRIRNFSNSDGNFRSDQIFFETP